MDSRDARRRSCSPRAGSRRRCRSSSCLRASSTSSDAYPAFRVEIAALDVRNRQDAVAVEVRGVAIATDVANAQAHAPEVAEMLDVMVISLALLRQQEMRGIRSVDSAKAVEGCQPRRIAPNASALKSIMLGTARSRDRMDERERARAQKKLEGLNSSTKPSTLNT